MEQYMDFEKKVQQVHKPNRVNPEALNALTGVKITPEWKITCKAEPGIVISTVVADLQDYFKVSMNVELQLATADAPAAKTIFVAEDNRLPERTFTIKVTDGIVVNGADPRYTAQGCYALEDKRPVVLELLEIIQAEIENAKNTIPLVEANSRLGYEKEYGYSCCKMQLEWKIAMAEKTINEELLPLLAQC